MKNIFNNLNLSQLIFFALLLPTTCFGQRYYFPDSSTANLQKYANELLNKSVAPDEYFETRYCIDSLASTTTFTRRYYFFVYRSISTRVNSPVLKRYIGDALYRHLFLLPKECINSYMRLSDAEKAAFDEHLVLSQKKKGISEDKLNASFKNLCSNCSKEELQQADHFRKILVAAVKGK